MNVPVQKARGQIAAGGIDHLGIGSYAVRGVTHVCDAAAAYGDVHMVQDLARVDVDQPCVANDGLGRLLSLRHGDKRAAAFPKRRLAKGVDHVGSSRSHPFLLLNMIPADARGSRAGMMMRSEWRMRIGGRIYG